MEYLLICKESTQRDVPPLFTEKHTDNAWQHNFLYNH